MTDAFEQDPQETRDQQERVIEPEHAAEAEPRQDPVTTRNEDPAAMSEHERNQRLSDAYDPQLPL